MPIPAHIRKQFYGKEWKIVTRPRILERAGDKCEQCRVPNRRMVARGPAGTWMDELSRWHNGAGKVLPGIHTMQPERTVYIVLTIAHLNHKPGDDRDENLKAWCQRCHLIYDQDKHRYTRATRKDAQRPLLNQPPTIDERTSHPDPHQTSIQTPKETL